MKTGFKTLASSVAATGLSFLLCASPMALQAESIGNTINEYFHSIPWIGMGLDEIVYGPITVSHVHLNKANRVVIVKPGEDIHGTLYYQIDASQQEMFHKHHLLVGIKDVGAQDCITHSYGIFDSNSEGHFTLKAPNKAGVYEVSFQYQEASNCGDALRAWNSASDQPSSAATIGVIIVKE